MPEPEGEQAADDGADNSNFERVGEQHAEGKAGGHAASRTDARAVTLMAAAMASASALSAFRLPGIFAIRRPEPTDTMQSLLPPSGSHSTTTGAKAVSVAAISAQLGASITHPLRYGCAHAARQRCGGKRLNGHRLRGGNGRDASTNLVGVLLPRQERHDHTNSHPKACRLCLSSK